MGAVTIQREEGDGMKKVDWSHHDTQTAGWDELVYPEAHPQGWVCPVCGRVYAPYVPMCWYCGNKETTTSTNVEVTG